MITHIRIQNLRSLVDTGFIEIKPLTILLGTNSSGKSTFLRSFPLFKQSVEKELREPISWFDESLVDFGDYDTAKSKFASKEDGIKFSYILKSPFPFPHSFAFYRYWSLFIEHTDPRAILDGGKVEISFMKDDKGTYVNSVSIVHPDLVVKMSIANRNAVVNYFVNNEPVLEKIVGYWAYGPRLHVLPEFERRRKADEKARPIEEDIRNYISSLILKYCSSRLKDTEKLGKLMEGWKKDKNEYLQYLRTQKQVVSLSKNAQNWNIDDEDFSNIYKALAILNLIGSMVIIESDIKSLYTGCSYIAPTRAAANRYYRSQGLQVRDVDPYGKNLQEFISSLSEKMRASYDEFTKRVLGIKVIVEETTGHQSIELESKYGKVNMTDVGFGYSQILPIITKLWYSTHLTKSKSEDETFHDFLNDTLLIEQPELHLHPAMQALTADAMMLVLNEIRKSVDILSSQQDKRRGPDEIWMQSAMIVETHSQAMINRIGKRIREKRFKAEDVSILMFEKDSDTGVTQIRPITYNEKGQLSNWPYGFFEPTDDYDTLFDRQSQD